MSPAPTATHSHPCSWWKAKLKDDNGGADGQVGLVPATYVEEVSPSVLPLSRHLSRSSSASSTTPATTSRLTRITDTTHKHHPRHVRL